MHTKSAIHTESTLTVDGASTLTGAITATGGVTGDVTGDVTGSATGANLIATTKIELQGGNGALLDFKFLTEETTMAQAASTATTIEIPAGCILLAVSGRVTGLAATTATYNIGITGDTARFASSVAVAVGTTFKGVPDVLFEAYAAAATVLVTPNASPTDDNGKIRFVIWYAELTPPTA